MLKMEGLCMSKIKTYRYSDFANTQAEAVQCFLHHAYDHMNASRRLASEPTFLDSSAYLCNMAFELLLKGMHLSENGQFSGIHYLTSLHNELKKKIFPKRAIPLIKLIDKYSLIRYPIDRELHKSQKKIKIGRTTFAMGEIGTKELKRANELFFRTWVKLKRSKGFKSCIEKIQGNPFIKGNRILTRKKRVD